MTAMGHWTMPEAAAPAGPAQEASSSSGRPVQLRPTEVRRSGVALVD